MLSKDKCTLECEIGENDKNMLPLVRGSPFEENAKQILETGKKALMDNCPNLAVKLTRRMNAVLSKNSQPSKSNEICKVMQLQEEILVVEENQQILHARPINVFGRDIYQSGMNTLQPGEELDDVIVDVSLMLARAENEAENRFELLSSIDFSAHFDSAGAQLMNTPEHYRDIINKEATKVLLPICIGYHWQLVVISGTDVQVYDSLANAAHQVITIAALERFLNAIEQKNWNIDFPECNQQNDCYSCGMFVYMFADKICGNKAVIDKAKLSRKALIRKIKQNKEVD